ncbi:hypothetical protein R3P38DRAFT_2851375 [Favolaschia claudopus]|uniref:Uncharacterized protein n=1 Tax=Favolaschia claudopus TaxID=2862362 RepID=A0AAW0DR80_9AGAR
MYSDLSDHDKDSSRAPASDDSFPRVSNIVPPRTTQPTVPAYLSSPTMVLRRLSRLYRLTLGISTLQIGLAVWAAHYFGFREMGPVQVPIFLYMVTFVVALLRRRAKYNKVRIYEEMQFLSFVTLATLMLAFFAGGSLFVYSSHTVNEGMSERLPPIPCFLLEIDILLPWLTCLILLWTMKVITVSARETFGEELVPLPPPPPPPVTLVPAWMTRNLDEVEDSGVSKDNFKVTERI